MTVSHSAEGKYFLADILDEQVKGPAGNVVGTVADFTMLLDEKYPKLSQVVIRTLKKTGRFLARRDQFSEFIGGSFRLSVEIDGLPELKDFPDLPLVRNIWDKQIVDIADARVMRVNDLQVAEIRGELRLLGVDIGTRGLIRRLGWEKWVCPLLEKLRLPVKEEIIAWDLVERLPSNFSQLKLAVTSQKLQEMHPADLADVLEELSVREQLNLLKSLDNETVAETLAETEPEKLVALFNHMPTDRVSDILEEMEPDEAADILQDLDTAKATEILNKMEPKEAEDVRELLKHDEDTAGGLMSTGFATIFDDFTIEDALNHLRLVAVDLEIIYYLYVIDKKERLKGVMSIRDILVAHPKTKVTEVMDDDLVWVSADTPQEEVANLIEKYNLLALPVLNEEQVMEGVVTVDDVIELLMDHLPKFWRRRARTS